MPLFVAVRVSFGVQFKGGAVTKGGQMVIALDSGVSGPGPGSGTLCCVLGQDNLLASHPGGSRNTPSPFMLQ